MSTILIIDDEQRELDTLGQFSRMLGYEPILIEDPSLCLPCLDAHACPNQEPCAKAIVVDQYLPTMFGLNFIEKLKRRGCKIPLGSRAIISEVFTSQESARANSLNFDVLLKPVTLEQFKDWLLAAGDYSPDNSEQQACYAQTID